MPHIANSKLPGLRLLLGEQTAQYLSEETAIFLGENSDVDRSPLRSTLRRASPLED
jgi:hypothetical protein